MLIIQRQKYSLYLNIDLNKKFLKQLNDSLMFVTVHQNNSKKNKRTFNKKYIFLFYSITII